MKVSHVTKIQMGSGGCRLDASFHMNDGIAARRAVSKLPYKRKLLREATEAIFTAKRGRRIYVDSPDHGIPFLGGSTMLKSDLSDIKLLSKFMTPDINGMLLEKDWILISCSGTIGKCIYTCSMHKGMAASQHIMRVVPNHTIPAGVLYAFLASKYGYAMLTQGMFGSVIQEIEPEYVASLSIPVFPDAFQKKVHSLVMESARLREEADAARKKAIRIMETEISMPLTGYKSASVAFNKVLLSQNKRLDANYHIGAGDACQMYIQENFEYKTLGELSKRFWRPEIFKRHYVQQGMMFLGSSDIVLAIPESKKFLSAKQTDIASLAVDENWILIPRSGTIGDCVLTNSQHARKLVSEHVIRFESNNILSVEYIFAFLSSCIGKPLIKKHMFGSVIQHVEPPLLSTIPIPILAQKTQTNITELMDEHRRKMGVSSAKEKEAIRLIEEEIEIWQK